MKIVSIVASFILFALVYMMIGMLTYDFFLPAFPHPAIDAAVFTIVWPLTWVIWGSFKIATNYMLTTVLSLVPLAGFYPATRLVSKLKEKRFHAVTLKAKRKAQESLQGRKLDEYLKANGVNLNNVSATLLGINRRKDENETYKI